MRRHVVDERRHFATGAADFQALPGTIVASVLAMADHREHARSYKTPDDFSLTDLQWKIGLTHEVVLLTIPK